jgi:hypothetical protein
LLKNDIENEAAYTLRGHAYYLMGNLFDSEESYIAALRIKSECNKKAAKSAADNLSPRSTGLGNKTLPKNMRQKERPSSRKPNESPAPGVTVVDPELQERLGLVYSKRKSW